MIKTSTQLKALIRNRAKGDSGKAQLLIRNYAMERFLERVSISEYKNNFVLKGGMLVSAMVGLDSRATQDIDTTIRNFSLDEQTVTAMITKIAAIPLEDGIMFELKSVSNIMDEIDYGGLRLTMNAYLERTRIPLKIDISTGDIITPGAVKYSFKLMFEERSIPIWAYNLETVLAEKIETILTRTSLNTRMRDYYDLYILQAADMPIDTGTLQQALRATSRKRASETNIENYPEILDDIRQSAALKNQWENYQKKNPYADNLSWENIMESVEMICKKAMEL